MIRFAVIDSNLEEASLLIRRCQELLREDEAEFRAFESCIDFKNDSSYFEHANILMMNLNFESDLRSVKNLLKEKENIGVMFYSEDIRFVPMAYDVEHFYFILKSQMDDMLEKALQKALEQYEILKRSHIAIEFQSKIDIVPICKIMYVERMNRKLRFVTKQKEYVSYMTLNDVTDLVGEDVFMRVQCSYLVQPKYVVRYQDNHIYLINGDCISVTRPYQKQVRSILGA